jgi:hypothetical protein
MQLALAVAAFLLLLVPGIPAAGLAAHSWGC